MVSGLCEARGLPRFGRCDPGWTPTVLKSSRILKYPPPPLRATFNSCSKWKQSLRLSAVKTWGPTRGCLFSGHIWQHTRSCSSDWRIMISFGIPSCGTSTRPRRPSRYHSASTFDLSSPFMASGKSSILPSRSWFISKVRFIAEGEDKLWASWAGPHKPWDWFIANRTVDTTLPIDYSSWVFLSQFFDTWEKKARATFVTKSIFPDKRLNVFH